MGKLVERTTIEIEHDEDVGLYYATSPDIRGLLVAEETLEQCWAEVPQTIANLRAAAALYAAPTSDAAK